jgi:anti-anti-sigma factor
MKSFTLSLKTDGPIVVMRPRGYLDCLGAEQIVEASETALRDGYRRILFDCADIRFINSVGISILVSLIQRSRDADCSLCFSNVSPVHREIFEVVGIAKFVRITAPGQDGCAGR